MPYLTKSKYLLGQQCLRLLWFANKRLLPEVSLADQHRFDQGHEFETYVYKLFPDGVDLSDVKGKENITRTQELVKSKKTIFEAGVEFEDLYVRSDILEFSSDGWNLYEIKSSTKVKPQHIPDLAFQKYVLEKAGIEVKRCFVLHLNKEYVKNGDIVPSELVSKEDVTEKVELVDIVEADIQRYLEIMKQENEPEITISKNCNKPYECPLKQHCWGTLPTNNVLHLTNWRQYWKFFEEGIIDMKDIPQEIELKPKDEVIRSAALKCNVAVSKEEIKHFLGKLKFPLYHFDFETFDTAIPIFDQSRPYQKIPFQYSLHKQHEDGTVEHYEYLADGTCDPRIELLERLENRIDGTGSVVVFNKSFEISVFTKLAEDFPEYVPLINKVLGRIVDLATPFQNFYYYCPTQKGSYSLKKVLPAVTGKDYSHLEVNNGAEASVQYFNTHIKKKGRDNGVLRKHLLSYCCLDTEGMVWIVDELRRVV
jgi:hypothetical protein